MHQSTQQAFKDVPSKILAKYTPLKVCWQTPYSKVIEACSRENTNEKYFIKTLTSRSDQSTYNYDLAATLFIQELLLLSSRLLQQKALSVQDFQIENRLMGYVTKPYQRLNDIKEETKPVIDIEKLVKDITADFEFLTTHMGISLQKLIDYDSIFKLEGPETYFLSNLTEKFASDATTDFQDYQKDFQNKKKLLHEKQNLASIAFELCFMSNSSLGSESTPGENSVSPGKFIKSLKSEDLKAFFSENLEMNFEDESSLPSSSSLRNTVTSSKKVVWCSQSSNRIGVGDIEKGITYSDKLYGLGLWTGKFSSFFLLSSSRKVDELL